MNRKQLEKGRTLAQLAENVAQLNFSQRLRRHTGTVLHQPRKLTTVFISLRLFHRRPTVKRLYLRTSLLSLLFFTIAEVSSHFRYR